MNMLAHVHHVVARRTQPFGSIISPPSVSAQMSPQPSQPRPNGDEVVFAASRAWPDTDNCMIGFLDSGSTRTIFTGSARQLLSGPFHTVKVNVTAAAQGSTLMIQDEGYLAPNFKVLYSTNLVRQSVVSVWELCDHGYKVVMAPHDGHVVRSDGQVVYLDTSTRGIWLVDMLQLFPASSVTGSVLSSGSCEQVYKLGAGIPEVDTLELFHRRTGHTSHGILREAVQSQLVTGVRLNRKHFSQRAKRQFKGCATYALRPRCSVHRFHAPRTAIVSLIFSQECVSA